MTFEEYKQWRRDAYASLTATRYTSEQAEVILEWMDRIKGADEHDLIGHSRFVGYQAYEDKDLKYFNLYNSLMSRMWVYAPHILEEEANGN